MNAANCMSHSPKLTNIYSPSDPLSQHLDWNERRSTRRHYKITPAFGDFVLEYSYVFVFHLGTVIHFLTEEIQVAHRRFLAALAWLKIRAN